MGEATAQKLIFIYTNHALYTKDTMSFSVFSEQFLEPEEHEALVDQLQHGPGLRALPASSGGAANDNSDDDAGSGDEGEETQEFMFAVPPGFDLVDKPEGLPTNISGMFILLLFNTGWCLGKVTEHKPRANKYKYVITYNDGARPTQLQMENYYEGKEEPEEPSPASQAGMWVLLKNVVVMAD